MAVVCGTSAFLFPARSRRPCDSCGDGVVALFPSRRRRGSSRVAAGAIEALQKQLFSRQLPEARSGSKINC